MLRLCSRSETETELAEGKIDTDFIGIRTKYSYNMHEVGRFLNIAYTM
jgi:hypothetical protein